MRLLRLDPGTAFKKSAKIVGDVMGNFHPHGDQAIYDALVRLAQDFASRYPLVDGQGNFGNIDGDNPAAYRYTEARMTAVAQLLLDGIEDAAVDFRPNYDGQSTVPVVLPGAFPKTCSPTAPQGIAVGMATAIPPHNALELCDAALFLIDNPNARAKTLLKYIKGPDFPTGGIVVDTPEMIAEAYATGRGSFRVRAKWATEDTGRGTYQIIITEIPWLVQKQRLIERMAELFNDKKLPLVAEFRDESTEDVRVVIEPKSRTVDAGLLMESLFKLTELESRIPLNMNVLSKGKVPKVMDLAEVLREWLDHRRDVLIRRSKHRLAENEHRLEVLGGLLNAYLNLDKVIKIIRTEDEPKPVLIRTFKLTDLQADSILNMRLRNLRKLEEMEINSENKDLRTEKAAVEKLLRSEKEQWNTVAGPDQGRPREVQQEDAARQAPHRIRRGARTRRGGHRRSHGGARADHHRGVGEGLDPRVARPPGRSVRRRLQDRRRIEIRIPGRDHVEAPGVRHQRPLLHHRRVEAAGRPRPRRAGAALCRHGAGDRAPVAAFRYQGGRKFLVGSVTGRGFVVAEDECLANTRKGKQVLNVKPPDEAVVVTPVEGDTVAAVGDNRKLVIFALDQVPEMARGRGVRLQRHKDGGLSDLKVFKAADGLTWIDSANRASTLTMKELAAWRGNRGDAGSGSGPTASSPTLKFGRLPENGKNGEGK